MSWLFSKALHAQALERKDALLDEKKREVAEQGKELAKLRVSHETELATSRQNEAAAQERELNLATKNEKLLDEKLKQQLLLVRLAERLNFYESFCVCVTHCQTARRWEAGPLVDYSLLRRHCNPWTSNNFTVTPRFVRLFDLNEWLNAHKPEDLKNLYKESKV